jgi:hypothetical protein
VGVKIINLVNMKGKEREYGSVELGKVLEASMPSA